MKNSVSLTLTLRPARRGGWLAVLRCCSLHLVHRHVLRVPPGANLDAARREAVDIGLRLLREAG